MKEESFTSAHRSTFTSYMLLLDIKVVITLLGIRLIFKAIITVLGISKFLELTFAEAMK